MLIQIGADVGKSKIDTFLTLRLNSQVRAKLDQIAEAQGRSVGSLVRRILDSYLDVPAEVPHETL